MEIACILFPESCITRASHEYNIALSMDFTRRSLIVHVEELSAETPGQNVHIFYKLGPDLSFRHLMTGNLFETTHARMYSQGKLDHAFNPAELEVLHNLTYLVRSSPPTLNSSAVHSR